MESLSSLNIFVLVADTRSFAAAGRQLGVSASAVGKNVARLEERVCVRLFHRNTRSITLTSEGEQLLERCRRIFSELEAASLELMGSTGTPKGRLRLSLPLIGRLLVPVLSEFAEAYPEIELELDFTDRLVAIVEEGFDAVVRTGDVADSRLTTRILGTFGHHIVGSPTYFRQRGRPLSIEDLQRHRCLHHKYETSGKLVPWRLMRGGIEFQPDLPKSIVVTTVEPLVQLAEQGRGIAYLPRYLIDRSLERGRLCTVLDDAVAHQGTLRLLWPASRYVAPKVRALIDFLTQRLNSDVLAGHF